MPEILNARLPVAPWMADHMLRLPGTTPIELADWLQRDEAYAGQMAYRDALIAEREPEVHGLLPGAEAAAAELLGLVLAHLEGVPGYARDAGEMRRPDGVIVALNGPPLVTAGRLVQEDLCLLEKAEGEAEHRLTGAILCFPSNWTLAQKLGRGLARIHLPVEPYDEGVARRVQRMFDLIRPEAPVMRANLLLYDRSDLWNPRGEFDRHRPAPGAARFVRVERQTILRLPDTRAMVFSIHTYMPRARGADARAARRTRRGPSRRLRGPSPEMRIFVLTGAGVSAESGLGTFRDTGGIWARFDPMKLATPEAFARDPAAVHGFYNARRRNLLAAAPNAAHRALADLADAVDLFLCTQNIDDLHERGGSPSVHHMHGELLKSRCTRCGTVSGCFVDLAVTDVCACCGRAGGLRPDVVWFGEMPYGLDIIEAALEKADRFVAVGTSGAVYPAAGYVTMARDLGIPTCEINLDASDTADAFDDRRYGPATETLPAFVAELRAESGRDPT